jgi:tRNA threonylcarbamoyladenosine biosynthesis protein TsaE
MTDSSLQEFLADEAATLEFGKRLARACFLDPDASPDSQQPGTPISGAMIYLQGDLGAGKTTLTRGILRGFGYEGAVKSPTYTLVEPYEFTQCRIYHFDLYRLADPGEVEYLGTEDYFANNNLCIVEWPERGGKAIPAADLLIELDAEGTGRRITCQSLSEKGGIIAKRLCP